MKLILKNLWKNILGGTLITAVLYFNRQFDYGILSSLITYICLIPGYWLTIDYIKGE